ncbi:MAG: energy-coupling factor transporter ATPase [Oscillospiraceae bacterium]|nr:energy-coupling factor transporter ATPase [Oscillospiraceae bacterium]
MDTMIKAENILYRYSEDSEPALKGVSVEIKKGEFVAVLGSNGCGKSTLAKHFNAILVPDEGDVIVDGINTREEDKLFDVRQRVGMVFQNPDNQIVATVVEEDVAFALENLGVPTDEIRQRIDEAMKQAGVYEFRKKAPHNLSGGQKQRVAIAGIIAMRPDCIVLDEPTAMLDPSGRASVMRTIKELNQKYGITIVLITHYMDEAAQADRVIVMSKGKVEKTGTPKEIFSQVEWIKSLSLDVPQTSDLAYELNKLGYNLSTEAISIDECAAQLYKFLEA